MKDNFAPNKLYRWYCTRRSIFPDNAACRGRIETTILNDKMMLCQKPTFHVCKRSFQAYKYFRRLTNLFSTNFHRNSSVEDFVFISIRRILKKVINNILQFSCASCLQNNLKCFIFSPVVHVSFNSSLSSITFLFAIFHLQNFHIQLRLPKPSVDIHVSTTMAMPMDYITHQAFTRENGIHGFALAIPHKLVLANVAELALNHFISMAA